MTARVRVASLLSSYTGSQDVIQVDGATLGEVVDALDRRFPGIAFRVVDEQGCVRRHMHVFVGQQTAADRATPIPDGAEIYIVGALSGG